MSAAEFSGGFRRAFDEAGDKTEFTNTKYTVYGRSNILHNTSLSVR